MKHSMKKILILLLTLACILAFAACGENETTSDIGDTATSSSSTETPTTGEPTTNDTEVPEPTDLEPTNPEPTEPEPTASEGLAFELNDDGESYRVTGIGECTDTDMVIPETYNGLPVTAIGNYAFCYYSGLTSIVIPDSVTSIGEDAFRWCGIINITFEATMQQWNAIEKISGWDSDTGSYVIHCTDGDISK